MDRIVWLENAKSNLKQILIYWKTKNQSDCYPRKLGDAIHQRIDQLLIFAEIETTTNFGNVRTLVIGKNFRGFYELAKKLNNYTCHLERQTKYRRFKKSF